MIFVRNAFVAFGILTLVGVGIVSVYVKQYIVTRADSSAPVIKECQTLIADATTAREAFEIGQEYFNGDRGYDLGCARIAYEKAVLLDARVDPWLWHQLGRIDFLEGHFSAAIFKFDRQIEYFGDTVPNVHYMRGLTYGFRAREKDDSEDWRLAEESFKQYLEYSPQSPWAKTDLSWILFSQGKYEEMKPILERGLEEEPNHPWLLNMYGLALLNTEQATEAIPFFEEALRGAALLTPIEWGRAYPGNDPKSWPEGLTQMQEAIEKNLALAESQ